MPDIFLNGTYHVTSTDSYFWEKYVDAIPQFILEDEVKEVMGKDWIKMNNSVVCNFIGRIKKKGIIVKDIKEPVLFGRIQSEKSLYSYAEIVLLSEIAFKSSVQEFKDLIDKKKIKIKSIT